MKEHHSASLLACGELRVAHARQDQTLADAFYAPVATRFRTYAIALSPAAAAYRDALLADDGVRAWEAAAAAQPAKPFSRSDVDNRHPDA